jgi:hypothetical protein
MNDAGGTTNPVDLSKEPIKAWLLVWSSIMVLASGAMCLAVAHQAQSFGELYAGFGADLPVLTALMINYAGLAILLPLVALVPLFFLFRDRKSFSANTEKFFIWIVVTLVLSFVLLGLAVIAGYLPIFRLGSTIG